MELNKSKNRCISCTFFCCTPYNINIFAEIVDNTRENIPILKSYDLKCFKGLMTPAQIKTHISLELKCTNSQGWRCHRDGLTPDMSFREEQNEREGKQFLWTKKGVVIAIISAIATLAVLGLTIYGIFFN